MEINFSSKKISEMDNYFIKVFRNVDFEYVFTTECMHLIGFASKIDKTSDLVLKLHSKFIEPISEIGLNNMLYQIIFILKIFIVFFQKMNV